MTSNSKPKEEPLDKEIPCYFCLKDSRKLIGSKLGPDLVSSEPVYLNNKVSLRHLSRFLDLVEGGGDDKSTCTSVPICDGCSKMTKEFSRLYQLFEETKLRVNWCVEKMYDVMKANKTANEENDDERNQMATLRRKIIERMTAVSKRTTPRVILKMSSLPATKTAKVVEQTNLCDQSTAAAAAAVAVDCPCCHVTFQASTAFYGAWKLRRHTLQDHCETLFPKEKLEFVTDAQYKKIFTELLFKDLITENGCCSLCSWKFGKVDGVVNFTGIKSHLIESHYAQLRERLMQIQKDPTLLETVSHRDASQRKGGEENEVVAQLIEDESTMQNRISRKRKMVSLESESVLPNDQTALHLMCSYCGTKFPKGASSGGSRDCSSPNLRRHMVQYHLEHFFPNCKLDSITNLQFQKVLTELMFRNVIVVGEPAEQKEKTMCFCRFCSKPFTIMTRVCSGNNLEVTSGHFLGMKVHMLHLHRMELTETLVCLLTDPNLEEMLTGCNGSGTVCKSCGLYIANANLKRTHERMYCTGNQSTFSAKLAQAEASNNIMHSIEEDVEFDGRSEEDLSLEQGEFLFEEEYNLNAIKVERDDDYLDKDYAETMDQEVGS